jgi:hypothetical protein
MPPDENPLRDILAGMVPEALIDEIAGRGTPVQYPAWIPVKHPFTGERVSVLAQVTDRIIPEDEREQTRYKTQFDLAAVTGTADDFFDSGEVSG